MLDEDLNREGQGTMSDALTIQRTIGQELRHYREYNAMSVDQLAQELYISRDCIDRIESDDYLNNEELSIFIRGYYRNYAKMVGYPIEELERRLIEEGAMQPRSSKPSQKFNYQQASPYKKWLGAGCLLVIIIMVIASVWYASGSSTDKGQDHHQAQFDNMNEFQTDSHDAKHF